MTSQKGIFKNSFYIDEHLPHDTNTNYFMYIPLLNISLFKMTAAERLSLGPVKFFIKQAALHLEGKAVSSDLRISGGNALMKDELYALRSVYRAGKGGFIPINFQKGESPS